MKSTNVGSSYRQNHRCASKKKNNKISIKKNDYKLKTLFQAVQRVTIARENPTRNVNSEHRNTIEFIETKKWGEGEFQMK